MTDQTSTVPRLVRPETEAQVYDLLATLNAGGVMPELACTEIGPYGPAVFVVNLRDPDAASVEYVHTDEDGHGHDDTDTADHTGRDCPLCEWRPEWHNTVVLLPVEPDEAVAAEYGYQPWWVVSR